MPTEPAWMSTTDNSPEPAWMSTAPYQTFGEALREYGRKMNPVPMLTGMGNAMLHPIEFTKNWMAQNEKLAQDAEQAHKEGRNWDAARHAINYFINSMPGLGTASQEAGDKLEQNDIAGGLADSAAVATQAALGIKSPAVMEGAGRLPSAVGTGVKAAAPGVIKGAGNIVLGTGLGEIIPDIPGPMGSVTRYVAAGSPIFRGARQISSALGKGFTAGRESLFPPPIRPTPLPAIGDEAAMYAAQQARLNSQATAPAATTAASTVPQPPPEALARLNSGVTTPTRAQSPAPVVQPTAAMLSRLNSGVNPRATATGQALFNEMQRSGSIPETARAGESFGGEVEPPDKFIARARETRSTSTNQLAEALHSAGIRSSDLPNVTAEQWAALAKAKGLGWPIGKPAQDAWIRDVIAALRRREGSIQ